LLQYGADTQLKTHEQQTAYDIAVKKHAQRGSAVCALPGPRTLAQLMRKIFAQGMPELMHYPDKLLMDNLVMLLSDEVCVSPSSAKERFYAAFMAMTGTPLNTF
jgi:6-phosphogluconolactonase/glucosamine-6-phosphate isomerase/deaminase